MPLRSPREWPSLLVTGGNGIIGSVLARAWPKRRIAAFDLPDCDARDLTALTEAARGRDVLVHLAWDAERENFLNNGFAPDNLVMARNALEAAAAAGVGRVVLASSIHADTYWPRPAQRVDPSSTPVPDSPYGASKVFIEALGRHYARHRGLEVAAVRFGSVTPDDSAPHDPAGPPVWLRHGDLVELVRAAAAKELGPARYALIVGVTDSADRIHDYGRDPLWPERRHR